MFNYHSELLHLVALDRERKREREREREREKEGNNSEDHIWAKMVQELRFNLRI